MSGEASRFSTGSEASVDRYSSENRWYGVSSKSVQFTFEHGLNTSRSTRLDAELKVHPIPVG